ncbi:hypothetical protein GUITHDRAFT_143369 [Guillardia theta CCMP2712]|uniref:Glutamine cyclotransferase n=1 Tax=Guillardia theta (strain CCMP2712) TaxID=905079 RepID=L1IUR6_GUITC|nr:hypothetical protein GUITHDRAFT_143369 [Guillardia theta CCMP2712]EKX39585.1 hypothetical protein GUITHDRAFT_143369 [Guillardia theta CCMP2712]|eukprot:XP_005826565.1 hypothetical protein GUITHDRAFT_143369 [Guillardia theta CCMP2712]
MYVFASLIFVGVAYMTIQNEEDAGRQSSMASPNTSASRGRSEWGNGGQERQQREDEEERGNKLQDRLLRYKIIETHPHDARAFTQGLEFLAGKFIESTGIKSSLREVEIKTGRVLRQHNLASQHFGEGCTVFKGKVYQLTWKTKTAFVYDIETFQELNTFTYDTDGWGITNNGKELIMSDGSDKLFFRDPKTFELTRVLNVVDPTNKQNIDKLNELEFIHGEIFANIWFQDRIARIDPTTGHAHGEDVLNGIAYDENRDRLWVTGKLWPNLFEIELV